MHESKSRPKISEPEKHKDSNHSQKYEGAREKFVTEGRGLHH